jgi:GNAT superfamily N-acetyltransferase
VGPAQVGQRVVLRRRLADGSAGDLLGDLVRWDTDAAPAEARVTVRTRAGDVTVAASDVLGGKPVPAAPPRRGRPHRTIDWHELERVAVEGWQPLERSWTGPDATGWQLRAAQGFTGRANSCLAVGDPGLPLADAIACAERWYAARALPTTFAVPWPLTARRLGDPPGAEGVDTDLDHELHGRGYRLDTLTLVLTAATAEVAVAMTPVGRGPHAAAEVELRAEPDDEWLSVYHYRGQELPPVARQLLLSAPQQVFASARDRDGHVVAVARGASTGPVPPGTGSNSTGSNSTASNSTASNSPGSSSPVARAGWVGVTAMEVDPAHRRRGLARLLLAALAGWAGRQGDASMYLQVAESNVGARELYASAGFAPHHGYHYRTSA